MFVPHLVEKPLNAMLSKNESKLFGSGDNLVYLGQLGVSVGLYSAMPMLANLGFRKKRAIKTGLYEEAPQATGVPAPAIAPVPVSNSIVSTYHRTSLPLQYYANRVQLGV